MENNQKGCCEGTEYEKEQVKDNISKERDSCCGSEENDRIEPVEEEAGWGCGCGASEYVDVDQSLIDNPSKPKVIASDDFIKEFEKYARSLGIKAIGYTQITHDLLIEDKFIQYPNTIVLTMEMSKKLIETAPGPETLEMNNAAYEKLGNLTYKLSDFLRKKGYATQVAHPFGSLVNFTPLAQRAGIGYIGKNGLLITPESGPGQKISSIFVSIANLPVKEENEHSWIPEYCEKCGKCIKACPEKALIEKETCCGGKEIGFKQNLCIGCSQGCTYCIEKCPFEEKGYVHVKNKLDKMNARLKEKQDEKFKTELWNNWAKQNNHMFTDLADGAIIALSMRENNERIILLKKEHGLKVSIEEPKHFNELENMADLLFIITEKDIAGILRDPAPAKFMDLINSGKIQIYGLISQSQLVEKGYNVFLYRLGLKLGEGCGCG